MMLDWIKWLISTFDIDGLRIDTVFYVSHEFWAEFIPEAAVFQIGEVFSQDEN